MDAITKEKGFFRKISDRILGYGDVKEDARKGFPSMSTPQDISKIKAFYRAQGYIAYNGEKNFGELGPVKDYGLNYDMLRQRSWDLLLESEIAQTVIKKYGTWVIGGGLRLQSQPLKKILLEEGIDLGDRQKFCESIESRFALFANSRMSDYSNMSNLNDMQGTAFKNACVGGDVLVILRYIDGLVKVQLIDGVHVVSPMYGSEWFPQALNNGNVITDGIEISPSGEHVAYYIRKPGSTAYTFETDRIPTKMNRSGLRIAYLVYGGKYRLDNHRGLPLLAVVLETAKKLERYKEATLGSAEERAKIAWTFEHDAVSTGENPLLNQTARAWSSNLMSQAENDFPTDTYGNELANKVAATTNKTVINMPRGSKAKSLDSKTEIHFKDFYSVNIDLVCAAIEIPPEVAMSKYDSNFSASRAALKDWENTLQVRRKSFSFEFLQPIYEFFLEINILKNKVTAPGYVDAKREKNIMAIEAYRSASWTGTPVPHIDPLKEVLAEREKLGATGLSVPLTTVEAATQALNGGDSDQNMEQYAEELEMSKSLGIIPEPDPIALDPNTPAPPAKKDKKKKKTE